MSHQAAWVQCWAWVLRWHQRREAGWSSPCCCAEVGLVAGLHRHHCQLLLGWGGRRGRHIKAPVLILSLGPCRVLSVRVIRSTLGAHDGLLAARAETCYRIYILDFPTVSHCTPWHRAARLVVSLGMMMHKVSLRVTFI